MTALALLQAATGVFFVTTGYRKVFKPEVRDKVIPFIMEQARVHREVAVMVTWAELLGGVALLTGILPQAAALGLLILMIVACVTTVWPEVYGKDENSDFTKLLSNLLCTPESQLVFILATLVVAKGY